MLSRPADHLFWMARYMEQAGQGAQRLAAKSQHRSALARAAVFSAQRELNDAV
jgi:uncharacterized alpha-E superfamily protein